MKDAYKISNKEGQLQVLRHLKGMLSLVKDNRSYMSLECNYLKFKKFVIYYIYE